MDIVVILLLVLDVILYIYFVNCLDDMAEVIDEITYKHNATIDLINSLNRRISKIEEKEKERDETNTKGREQKE